MGNRREENIRAALEAEGASKAEIEEALFSEQTSDPTARARRAGVPPLYAGVTWDSIEEDEPRKEAILAARQWARGVSLQRGLYLWSEGEAGDAFGVGKTRIAAAAVAHILDRGGKQIRWLDCARLMTDLNLPFRNPQHERAAAKLQPPASFEVIILDDIDKMPATDRNVAPLFTLINDCVNAVAPLAITANRSLDSLAHDFGERFGEALASRLVGHCLDVEVGGRDRRLDP